MAKIFGMDIDNKNKYILTSAIFIVTFLICFNIVKRGVQKADNIRRNISEISEKNILREDIESIERTRQEYGVYFYGDIDQNSLRNIVSNIASETGIEIVSIKPLTKEIIGNIFKESLDISLRSTYNQFGMFVSRLENLERITKIESVAIEKYPDLGFQESIEKSQMKIREPDPDLPISVVISAYAIKE
jgi:Tfp pilus assembly protein PilO